MFYNVSELTRNQRKVMDGPKHACKYAAEQTVCHICILYIFMLLQD